MKKTFYAIINFKQFIFCLAAIVAAAAVVFGLEIHYASSASVSAIESREAPLIIIDAGHGGEDGGTSSSSGIIEKDINLSIALKTQALLESFGFETLMTRSDDRMIYDDGLEKIRDKKVSDIHNRMKIIESNPESIFVSIHQNHFEQSKYNGAQVFYSKNNEQSEAIAQSIQSSIVNLIQPENTRQIKPSGTEIYLLYHAALPAVMVECGFLSNGAEAQLLNDSEYQTKMAVAISQGIIDYLNSK